MLDRINDAPWTFWLHLAVLVTLLVETLRRWNAAWAKPSLAVYGTVAFWYTGDFLVAEEVDYSRFEQEVVTLAFFQVTMFLVVFRSLLPRISRKLSGKALKQRRMRAFRGRLLPTGQFSPQFLNWSLGALIAAWAVVFATGAFLAGDLWAALLWPPLHSEKVGMYPLVGMGSGGSFIFAAMGYIHMFICAMFGVLAVVARGPTRWIAIVMLGLSWPYFWFDRARTKMLALLLPGMGAFWLAGRQTILVRVAVSAVLIVAVQVWFLKVLDYRSGEGFVAFDDNSETKVTKHYGQDMLKELCWVNTFIAEGSFRPNWGQRYLAELANPIPRVIWPGKPMVGIDYSIARGFGGANTSHGVHATIATGMIGQGCVNFGRFFGVLAAAGIFALWAGFLARLWCQRASPLRLALFLLGMGLTFNTGRDFTLLVLFPFLFGYIAVVLSERFSGKSGRGRSRREISRRRRKVPMQTEIRP